LSLIQAVHSADNPRGSPLNATSRYASRSAAGAPNGDRPFETGTRLTQPLAWFDTRFGFAAVSVTLLLVAFWLRVRRLGTFDLWLDEAISYVVANRPPLDVIAYSAQNMLEHPPGYYFLLHYWMRLAGSGEMALRFFSAVGGTLCVALVIMLARRWFGHRMGIVAGLLFCVQPLAVTLSRDTRMYTWYGAAVLLMVYLFDRALHDGRALSWLLFGAASLAALTINYLTAFVLVGLAVFAAVQARTLGRRIIPFAVILLVLLGLPFLWIMMMPGPRGSALLLLNEMRIPWSPARLVGLFYGWPLSGAADDGPTPWLAALAGLRWLLAIAGILTVARPRAWERRAFQWLLVALVFIAPLAGSFVFVIVKQRYFSAVLGFFVLAIASAIAASWRRSRPAALALLAALVLMDGRAAIAQGGGNYRPFSVPMGHILSRAREAEPIVYTYHWDKYLDLYYDSAGQPAAFVPAGDEPTTIDKVEATAREVLADAGSAWLVMYPSKLKPEIVQAGFNRAGYPTEMTWFGGGRGVARYFSERDVAGQSGGAVWADRYRLNRWWASEPTVTAGDALRLQFEWQNLAPGSESDGSEADRPLPLVLLTLVGPDGQAWATRLGAPCGEGSDRPCRPEGWREPVLDRQAFYVPLDTPPGAYTLRVAWLTPDGETMLVRTPDDDAPQGAMTLLDVTIDPPRQAAAKEAPLAIPSGLETAGAGLTLLSFSQPTEPVLAGSTVVLPMQWQVHAAQSPLEVELRLERQGETWSSAQPAGPQWYGSDRWTAGRLVRAQPQFKLRGTLAPGEYAASLIVSRADGSGSILTAPLNPVVIKDRERRFDVPPEGEPVNVAWQEGVQLVRATIPDRGVSGETLPVTLVWQADRPTAGNWKVFVHLVDDQGAPIAQGDAYPLGGTALTTTWQPGEVLVDTYPIRLPADLSPGTYRLNIGFYDEATDERLPLSPGVDTWTWPGSIAIEAP